MEKKHKKKCLPSLAIKKYKARPRWYSTSLLLELVPSRKPTTTNVGKEAGEKEPSDTAGGNVS
jgi:hypothetical protein